MLLLDVSRYDVNNEIQGGKRVLCAVAGWRPRRTIMFALWDAAKYGNIGSYEWVQVLDVKQ